MSLVGAPTASLPAVRAGRSLLAAVLVPTATMVVIVALALLPLLLPAVLHPMLTAARADAWLGMTLAQAQALSDGTVHDLVLGGSFHLLGPDGRALYGSDEVAHLQDARALLWLFLGVAGLALVALVLRLRRPALRAPTWSGIARGGAVAAMGTVLIGLMGLIAFQPLFELFHRVFFPGGNWAFDPGSQRLVQLYPFAFWQLAAGALGVGVIVLGSGAWLLGRMLARRPT